MKKNIFSKILLALLIVILAFSIAACGNKKTDDDDNGKNENNDNEEESNLVTMQDLAKILGGVTPLLQEIDSIEDEIHIDAYLLLEMNGEVHRLAIQGNIYANDHNANQVLIELREFVQGENDKIIFGAYLKNNVLYLNQGFTATQSLHRSKFSNLDALELSQALSKLPGFINDQELDLAGKIADLAEDLEGLDMINEVLSTTEILEFFETDNFYELKIVSENLGFAASQILALVGDLGEYQGLVDFVSNIIFGTDVDSIAEVTAFPSLSIKAKRTSQGGVNGILIDYLGIPSDGSSSGDKIEIELVADVFSSKAVTVDFVNLNQFVEGALKVSVDLDLGMKDLSLAGNLLLNPNFVEDGPSAYLSDFVLRDKKSNTDFAVNAEYDGKTILFDLLPFYQLLNVAAPAATVYGIEFDVMQIIDDARNAEEEEEEEEEVEDKAVSSLPFALADNWLSSLFGKIDLFVDILSATMDSGSLDLSLDTILDPLFDGILVHRGEDGKPTKTAYEREDMIADINAALAKFAENYQEGEEYSQEELANFAKLLVKEITGVDIFVADIINASGSDSITAEFGLLEDALGIMLDLAIANNSVFTFSLELDIIAATEFAFPETSYFDGLIAGETYIDLNSEYDANNPTALYNVYYVMEGEGEEAREVAKFVILDELVNLLDAYREFGQE